MGTAKSKATGLRRQIGNGINPQALGIVTSYTMGGLIHILLVIAVIVILVRLISGRRIG